MKKVTGNVDTPFKFLVRGVRNTANAIEVEISKSGEVVSDEDAAIIKDRLGVQVTISDYDAKDAKKEADSAVTDAEKEAAKAAKEAEKEAAKVAKEAEKAAKKAAKEADKGGK